MIGAVLAGWVGLSGGVLGREFRVNQIPNGAQFGCANCHVSPAGGGARNSFGLAVFGVVGGPANRPFWSATLAALDSDGDGAPNGVELGDPDGDGTPVAGAAVTNPGNAASRPPENVAPTVAITAPVDGTVRAAPAVLTVEATATDADGSVARVEFFDGDRLLGVDVEAPYQLLVDWSLGAHVVTARATDNLGASATSAAVNLTVNAPEATRVTRVARSEAGVEVEWTAGGGPYVVQGKPAAEDPWCSVGEVTTGLSRVVAFRGDGGLFRVADLAVGEVSPLGVVLSGAYERPAAVETAGTGSGWMRVEGSTLTFRVEYAGLSGPAIMAHIHGPSGADGTAGVMIDLAPFNGGGFGVSGVLEGSVVLTAEQKASILSGRTYVNVHTDANRGGEIRGQVVPVAMAAVLDGAQEAPTAVAGPGRGSAHFVLEGDRLGFVITYGGLSGPATMAHIHGPAGIGVSAGVLVNLLPFHDGPTGVSGRFEGSVTLSPEQLVAVVSGLTYVNIHTDANRPGEIRGQILPSVTGVPLGATLNGASEVPPVETAGVGRALMRLEGDMLSFDIRYGGLSGPAIMAHIHGPAAAGANAGVLVNLAPFHVGPLAASGAFTGVVRLTTEQREALLGGLTYVNIHTDANRPGEIRGQLLRLGNP